jgi:hypothetical protein
MPRILFDVVQEYYWPAMEPLWKVMSGDPSYELCVRVGENYARRFGVFLLPQKRQIEEAYRRRGFKVTDDPAGFDAVICGDTLPDPGRYGDALLCNVDHGPCFKTLRYRNLLKQPDVRYVVFAEGRYRMERLADYGLDAKETVVDVGLPKLDPFFWGWYKRETIERRYGLDPARKTVLYAPTYKPTSLFLVGERILDLVGEFNVIVKLHPYSWNGRYAPHSQHRLYERLAKSDPRLKLVPEGDHNIMPYLFAADVLISEASSVINEFLALERCGVIFDLKDEKLKHTDGEPLLAEQTGLWLKDSFVHIDKAGDLLRAVREAAAPSEERRRGLKRDKEYIYSSTDGTSSQKAKAAIERLLRERKG